MLGLTARTLRRQKSDRYKGCRRSIPTFVELKFFLEAGLKRKGLPLWSIIAVVLAVLAGVPRRTNAQLATTTATLSGTVNDPGGALIPQAKVTLTSPETGTSRESATNDSGQSLVQQP